MKRISALAGSLVLSGLNALVCATAFFLAYADISPWWGALMIWIMSPPLVLFAGAYLIRDLLDAQMRKQALIAIALFVPVAVLDWHFRFTGI